MKKILLITLLFGISNLNCMRIKVYKLNKGQLLTRVVGRTVLSMKPYTFNKDKSFTRGEIVVVPSRKKDRYIKGVILNSESQNGNFLVQIGNRIIKSLPADQIGSEFDV